MIIYFQILKNNNNMHDEYFALYPTTCLADKLRIELCPHSYDLIQLGYFWYHTEMISDLKHDIELTIIVIKVPYNRKSTAGSADTTERQMQDQNEARKANEGSSIPSLTWMMRLFIENYLSILFIRIFKHNFFVARLKLT